MKVADGLVLNNESYILSSAVSATYDSAGNNIATALSGKQNKLTAGEHIAISNDEISVSGIKPVSSDSIVIENSGDTVSIEVNEEWLANHTVSDSYLTRAKNEGSVTVSSSYALGTSVTALGAGSVAEGYHTIASGDASHSEGSGTSALNDYTHAEGQETIASAYGSHAEGYAASAIGYDSHAEGQHTVAYGYGAHAEGITVSAIGNDSHAEGCSTIASGTYAHAEGQDTSALGGYSHAEGRMTLATSHASHAEGKSTSATQNYTHSEGYITLAAGEYSHAEGNATSAIGNASHAEGDLTIASGNYSHAEGYKTSAIGNYSHAEGDGTIAYGETTHAQGRYNTIANSDQAFIIGNGVDGARSDAMIVDWDGNVSAAGYLRADSIVTSGGLTAGCVDLRKRGTGSTYINVYPPTAAGTTNWGGSAVGLYWDSDGKRGLWEKGTPASGWILSADVNSTSYTFNGTAKNAKYISDIVTNDSAFSSAPASVYKDYFTNSAANSAVTFLYNQPGDEKIAMFSKRGTFGTIFQLNYVDTYPRMLRYRQGTWQSTDWEKIKAGYADEADVINDYNASSTKIKLGYEGNSIESISPTNSATSAKGKFLAGYVNYGDKDKRIKDVSPSAVSGIGHATNADRLLTTALAGPTISLEQYSRIYNTFNTPRVGITVALTTAMPLMKTYEIFTPTYTRSISIRNDLNTNINIIYDYSPYSATLTANSSLDISGSDGVKKLTICRTLSNQIFVVRS